MGVDLGGTGVKGVAITEKSKVVASFDIPTVRFEDAPISLLIEEIEKLVFDDKVLVSIGIGASGPVNLKTNLINNADTLPQFTGVDLIGALSNAFGVPVCIDNDAIAAAYAEYEWTFNRKVQALAMITLGTGIGVAALRNGQPMRNLKGEHPELGHIATPGSSHPCYCGLDNCWEQSASRKALEMLFEDEGYDNPFIWREYAKNLSDGLLSIINGLDPEVIVIGGSVAQYWDKLENLVHENLQVGIYTSQSLKVVPSKLGPLAGAQGAALIPEIRLNTGLEPA